MKQLINTFKKNRSEAVLKYWDQNYFSYIRWPKRGKTKGNPGAQVSTCNITTTFLTTDAGISTEDNDLEAQVLYLTTLMCLCFINGLFIKKIKRSHKLKERAVSHFSRGAWHALMSLKMILMLTGPKGILDFQQKMHTQLLLLKG